MIVFKIRRKADGLFSTGGSWPRFTKKGKLWKAQGHLTSHLTQVQDHLKANYITDCEIVEYELIEQPVGTLSIASYMQEAQDRKDARRKEYEDRRAAYRKEQRRKEYEELQKEFGDSDV